METSTELQDRFLADFFSSSFAARFYLTGGTALARFYFHHRVSVDLDLFTHHQEEDFDALNRTILTLTHPLGWRILNQVTTASYLQYIFLDAAQTTLKIDIVKDIPVRFGEIETRGIIRLDSLENIGSNKVLAVFGRTDAKDFIDLYWILHHSSFTFEHLFALALQKDLGLSELYFAYAIQNVKNITHFPHMLKPLPWETIRAYFLGLSQDMLDGIKPK